MLRGSAKCLHRSRPSCQPVQGAANTNPTEGPLQAIGALSPCNQSSIKRPSSCTRRRSPQPCCRPRARDVAASEPTWLALPPPPLPACGSPAALCAAHLWDTLARPRLQAGPLLLSLACSSGRLGWPGCRRKPRGAPAAPGAVLSPSRCHLFPLPSGPDSPFYSRDRPVCVSHLPRGCSQK